MPRGISLWHHSGLGCFRPAMAGRTIEAETGSIIIDRARILYSLPRCLTNVVDQRITARSTADAGFLTCSTAFLRSRRHYGRRSCVESPGRSPRRFASAHNRIRFRAPGPRQPQFVPDIIESPIMQIVVHDHTIRIRHRCSRTKMPPPGCRVLPQNTCLGVDKKFEGAKPPPANDPRDHVWIGADVLHEMLPDMQLRGGVAIDALADFAVYLVPWSAGLTLQVAPQGGEVLVEIFVRCLKPRTAHSLAAAPLVDGQTIAIGPGAEREGRCHRRGAVVRRSLLPCLRMKHHLKTRRWSVSPNGLFHRHKRQMRGGLFIEFKKNSLNPYTLNPYSAPPRRFLSFLKAAQCHEPVGSRKIRSS